MSNAENDLRMAWIDSVSALRHRRGKGGRWQKQEDRPRKEQDSIRQLHGCLSFLRLEYFGWQL
jgi:hypothetical protein